MQLFWMIKFLFTKMVLHYLYKEETTMKTKKLICLLLSVVMTMSLLTAFAQDNPYPDIPAKVAPTEQITCAPSQNNAYTVLGDTVTSNKMTYIDGIEQGITDTSNPLYSQKFEMAGVKGRKVFKQNILYFKLDHENYDFSGEYQMSIS